MKKLFNLMDGLSMNEKRYFKTHTKSSRALQLFNIINQKHKDFSSVKKFSSREKNYLFNSILRTLRDFHNDTSANRVLDNYIHEISILINKELYDIAMGRIQQAEKLAVKYEKLYHQILLVKLKKRIDQYMGLETVEKTQSYFKSIKSLGELMVTDYKLEEFLNYCREEAFLRPKTIFEKDLNKLIAEAPVNLQAQIKQHFVSVRIQAFSNFHNENYVESCKCYERLNKRFESLKLSSSSLDNYSWINYITGLHGYLSVLKEMNSTKEYFNVIEILKNTKGASERENNKNFVNMSISITDYFLKKNEIKKGIGFLEEYKRRIETIVFDPDRMELLYFNTAYIYFVEKRFREANKYLYKYIVYKNPRYIHIYKASYFMYIITQIELGNTDFGISLLDKYVKRLTSENFLTDFDRTVEQFIKTYFIKASEALAKQQCQQLSDIINNYPKSATVININEYFNFKGWMELKLFKSPFQP